MKRGEIWTVSGGAGYAGKPRSCVILQDDRFHATGSVTLCAFTTDPTDAPLFRLAIDPDEANGLRAPYLSSGRASRGPGGRLMVDKITTVARSKLGSRVGRLADSDLARLNRAVFVFLGLGETPSARIPSVRGK